jgi:hypothetical protein
MAPGRVRAKRKSGTCTYCGNHALLTDDHVPPECLFEKPRPQLVTVPSCDKCNRGASKDDEYFKYAITMSDQGGDNPKAASRRAGVIRSLTRDEAAGFRRQVFSSLISVELKSPAGLILGSRLAFDVDLKRLFRVIQRIVKGLYFHESGRSIVLPPSTNIVVYNDHILQGLPPQELEKLGSRVISPLARIAPVVIEPNTFHYRFQFITEVPDCSAWALTFYKSVTFLVGTAPKVPPSEPSDQLR